MIGGIAGAGIAKAKDEGEDTDNDLWMADLGDLDGTPLASDQMLPPSLQQRHSVRYNPEVLKEMERWFAAFATGQERIQAKEFVGVFVRIDKALLPKHGFDKRTSEHSAR